MESAINNQEFYSRTKTLIDEVSISSEISSTIPLQWDEFTVCISIEPAWSNTYAGQLMLLSSINMIGRFCNRLFFDDSLSKVKPIIQFPIGFANNMLDNCINIARNINPFSSVGAISSWPKDAVTFGVGVEADITIASNNWLSYLNWNEHQLAIDLNQNPFGPMFASCLGSAEVFRKLISRLGGRGPTAHRSLSNIQYSTLDYSCNDPLIINPSFPSFVDIGNILIAGSGAVANGIMAALYMTNNVKGIAIPVDDEKIDLSNVSRYSLTTLADVGKEKTSLIARLFQGSKMTISPINNTVESITSMDMNKYDIVISALDNRNNNSARIYLQNLLPKYLIHAATHGLSVAVANINYLDGICLGCLFSPRGYDITTVSDPICGGVTIRIKNKSTIAASVSFVSTACGILAASELIKKVVPCLNQFSLNNYLSLSLMSPDLSDVRFREKDNNCLCLCSEPIRHESYKSKYNIE